MASVIPKSNGTYLIRVSCGLDGSGKQITRSKTFKPSKPNLSYQRLNEEIDQFIAEFELEVKSGGKGVNFDKITFSEFCVKYLEQKKTSLSPTTYIFYEMIIRTELLPMFGTMKLRDIKTYHVQQFIQYLATENVALIPSPLDLVNRNHVLIDLVGANLSALDLDHTVCHRCDYLIVRDDNNRRSALTAQIIQ